MNGPSPVPQVFVRGQAMLVVEPEIAELGVSVTGRARDRQSALEHCQARQQKVDALVEAAGAAVETAETTGVSVHLEARARGGEGSPVATVHTRLTIGRLDAVGDLVVALGQLDDVSVTGPWWRLRPASSAVEQARLAAVRDAVHRASQYAAAFGAELTALLEVRDADLAGGDFRVASPASGVAPFGDGGLHLDLTPVHQEVHGAVEVRFAMSAPDQEVFRS